MVSRPPLVFSQPEPERHLKKPLENLNRGPPSQGRPGVVMVGGSPLKTWESAQPGGPDTTTVSGCRRHKRSCLSSSPLESLSPWSRRDPDRPDVRAPAPGAGRRAAEATQRVRPPIGGSSLARPSPGRYPIRLIPESLLLSGTLVPPETLYAAY